MNYEANIIKNCFKNKNCFLHCFERVKNSEIFTDNRTKLYWECFVNIYTEKEDICYSTVEDVLSFSNNDELIEDFRELVTTDYDDEDQWKYHLYFLEEQFKKKALLRISKSINSNLGAYSADEVIHQINNQLRNLSSDDTPSLTFQSAFRNTLGVLQDLQEGNVRPMLETGNCLFDNVVGISKSKLIVVASQKKIGKSRWMVDLMDRTIEYNENVAILWFSLEMLSDEMIRCFISRRFKVTDNALLGKGGGIDPGTLSQIEGSIAFFNNYPIEFVDKPVDIYNIVAKFEQFKEVNENKHCICVIDNLGLITPHTEGLAFDDDVSRLLKACRDKTEGTIFVVHHLTKESEGYFNKENGYQPKLSHIRGSSRIVDFANQVLLLHRPDNYNDLMDEAKKNGTYDELKQMFMVDVAANRSGPTEIIVMNHDIKYCYFEERQ
jgi:replicative DNA helicase